MKEAIQKAIEGGWLGLGKNKRKIARYFKRGMEEDRVITYSPDYDECEESIMFSSILLDPLFWSALGKAEGWPVDKRPHLCKECGVIGWGTFNHMNACKIRNRNFDWKTNWHNFIDKIASGGTVDEFFKELLKA